MSDPRSDPLVRKISLLVSALVLTADSALEAYRARRTADPALDLASLERARAILDAVGYALLSRDKSHWRRIDDAWEILRRIPKPPAETPVPKPSAPAVVAAAPAAATASPAIPPPANHPPPWPPIVVPSSAAAGAPLAAIALENVQETAPIDRRLLNLGSVLPFASGEAKPPRSAVAELPPLPQEDIDGTAFGAVALEGSPLPFNAELPPELGLEPYASLCAELRTTTPERAAEIARRYGLRSQAALQALDRSWRKRLDADERLRTRFDQLVSQYAGWLGSQQKR